MTENLLAIITISCAIMAYFAKPSKPFVEILIKPNENFLNKVSIKFNEEYTSRISQLFTRLSFLITPITSQTKSTFSANSNSTQTKSKQLVNGGVIKSNSVTNKIQRKEYYYKYINYKPLNYISDDGTYGQYVIIDC